ncbi:hypothetical protein DFH06DRAFT_1353546 [Mycena polygramma]|nr:hypothetical protein DFH06DRAFT_1353546 [Mycena polygramma]
MARKMARSHKTAAQSNECLDKLNQTLRIERDTSVSRPVLRRPHHERIAQEESTHQKMSRQSKDERAAIQRALQQNEKRRAKARERMALRRARIKALPPDEQIEYQEKARQARAKWRAENRRYLQIASWDYRNRKFIEMQEAHGGGDRTRYEEYISKSTIRGLKKNRAERRQERLEAGRPEQVTEPAADDSDLPDSSEIFTSDESA